MLRIRESRPWEVSRGVQVFEVGYLILDLGHTKSRYSVKEFGAQHCGENVWVGRYGHTISS